MKKSMYGMTNLGRIFSEELINFLMHESGFRHSKCQMSIYYNYAPDVSKLVVLSHVDECVYWYKSEELGKLFVDTLLKIFHVKFLGYAH